MAPWEKYLKYDEWMNCVLANNTLAEQFALRDPVGDVPGPCPDDLLVG
jgi:hypothetical protein